MSFIHDVIKIKYVKDGYLPNYPYHLISDQEMFDAFLKSDIGFFDSFYTCEFNEFKETITSLKEFMSKEIETFLSENSSNVPDWIYTYMLGEVVCPNSDKKDIHDLLVLLECDNTYDNYTEIAFIRCLSVSKKWLTKIKSDRPTSCFGEPNVIKSLRLQQLSV